MAGHNRFKTALSAKIAATAEVEPDGVLAVAIFFHNSDKGQLLLGSLTPIDLAHIVAGLIMLHLDKLTALTAIDRTLFANALSTAARRR